MSKYVFISNSTKPTEEKYNSLEDIKLSNVERPCLEAAKKLGYEIILGVNRKYPEKLKCDEMDIKFYNAHTFRSIVAFKDNYIAYKNLCDILENGDIEVIHCNTPIGGLMGRLCGHKYKVPKIIYTVHGFHFFKDAPLFNNTILKWAEYLMAHWTDVIITINEEDYQAAQKMHLKNGGKVYKVNGVGINLEDYQHVNVDRSEYRKQLGLKEDDFVCIAMGDLVKRKNFSEAIEVIAGLKDSKVHYLICGEGPEKGKLQELSKKLGIEKQIHFLGYRSDIKELLKISDCFLFLSKQEGLPRSTMEAMASGLPCVVSKIRGHVDLLGIADFCQDKGYCFTLEKLINDKIYLENCSKYCLKKIKKYSQEIVKEQIKNIYNQNVR